eukprot:2683755-Rhodomonas_salina.2
MSGTELGFGVQAATDSGRCTRAVSSAICLRACYGMSGSDRVFCPAICLCVWYAMRGTGLVILPRYLSTCVRWDARYRCSVWQWDVRLRGAAAVAGARRAPLSAMDIYPSAKSYRCLARVCYRLPMYARQQCATALCYCDMLLLCALACATFSLLLQYATTVCDIYLLRLNMLQRPATAICFRHLARCCAVLTEGMTFSGARQCGRLKR